MGNGYTKEQIFALLDNLEIPYQFQLHDAVYTMDDAEHAVTVIHGSGSAG